MTLKTNTPTVAQITNEAVQQHPDKLAFMTDPDNNYIVTMQINGEKYTADLTNNCYKLPPTGQAKNNVFWFYSIDGRPRPGHTGQDGQGFNTYPDASKDQPALAPSRIDTAGELMSGCKSVT